MKETLKQALEAHFRPEFLNRLDDIIVFRPLTREDLQQIVDIELEKVYKRLAEKGLKLQLTPEAREFLIDKGYSPEFGARPLRRAIEHLVEDPLSEELLRGAFIGKDTILVKLEERDGEKKLVFEGLVTGESTPQVTAPVVV
jgi:ATP-dependent Clp protease ATP-binding subunit ClpC